MQHPQPEYRMHKTISKGQFAPGAAIAQDATIRVAIPIASAGKVRFRFECDVGGELVGKFLSPGIVPGSYTSFENELDGTDAVATTGLPAAVTVTADTEALLEVNDLGGEAYLLVEFTEEDAAAGNVTHANYCQL
ncbi:MAG: hypothetical protein KAJ42_00535 [Gemmatimonadetes bacterium]|nr:hypothetical protein [Gemmatimonadota bacterium]